jgi:hypothetical protein
MEQRNCPATLVPIESDRMVADSAILAGEGIIGIDPFPRRKDQLRKELREVRVEPYPLDKVPATGFSDPRVGDHLVDDTPDGLPVGGNQFP